MDVAAAEEDLARRHPDRLALGKDAAEDRRGILVVARVEQRLHDPRVAEVEVDLGGGEAVAGAARLGALTGIDALGLLG